MSFSPIGSPDPEIDAILPDEDPAPLPADQLEDLDDTEGLADAAVLEVEEDPVVAFGRSWSFNFVRGRFDPNPIGGPAETRGLQTLRVWVEKALRTEGNGSYPIYSTAYGFVGVDEIIGHGQSFVDSSDLGDKIWEALTFHPRITDVVGFKAFIDPDDETLFVTFTAITDKGDEIAFTDFRVF